MLICLLPGILLAELLKDGPFLLKEKQEKLISDKTGYRNRIISLEVFYLVSLEDFVIIVSVFTMEEENGSVHLRISFHLPKNMRLLELLQLDVLYGMCTIFSSV